MSEQCSPPYWIEPTILYNIGRTLTEAQAQEPSFADVCKRVLPMLAQSVEVEGVENIPSEGPVIVLKNHPSHFDGHMLKEIFARRPDIRHVVGTLRFTEITSPNYLPIRRADRAQRAQDIQALRIHLAQGGSIISTPWGSLDHEAKNRATKQRAVQNALGYVAFSHGQIVPVYIDMAWDRPTTLPVKSARISIQEPIEPTESAITNVVSGMYEKYVR